MTVDEAVRTIDGLDDRDPMLAHATADTVLYEFAPEPVQDAWERLVARCDWWGCS